MAAKAALARSPAAGTARRRPYRVAELADLWDLDASTVYRMIYAGRLRAERHGPRGGALRVPVDAVTDYLRLARTGAFADSETAPTASPAGIAVTGAA